MYEVSRKLGWGMDSGQSEGPGTHISLAWCWVVCRVGRSEGGQGLWFSSTSKGSVTQRGPEGIHLLTPEQAACCGERGVLGMWFLFGRRWELYLSITTL